MRGLNNVCGTGIKIIVVVCIEEHSCIEHIKKIL